MSDDLIEKIARAIDRTSPWPLNDSEWQIGLEYVRAGKDGNHYKLNRIREALSDARAALSAIEKSGTHVVVPKEPTDEMFANASDSPGSRMACQHVWADMLSARPPLPEGEKT